MTTAGHVYRVLFLSGIGSGAHLIAKNLAREIGVKFVCFTSASFDNHRPINHAVKKVLRESGVKNPNLLRSLGLIPRRLRRS